MLFRLEPLTNEEIQSALEKALKDSDRGLGEYSVDVDREALEHMIMTANGDLRKGLNALELAVTTTELDSSGIIHVTKQVAEESIQQPALKYDKADQRYDMVSALIKSIRGSATDAALYWMARMLESGEDPKLIMRRLIVHASEDIGMANPTALQQAIAAFHALETVGLPEARINMAQCVIFLAESPKSNSVIMAIDEALQDVRSGKLGQIPKHLRDAHYKGAKELGHGVGYKYPHNFPHHYTEQDYLPEDLKGRRYYTPSDQGMEQKLQQRRRD